MEDVGKAIIMASHIILFLLACSVSIFLYSSITNAIDGALLAKDYSNRGDAIVGVDQENIDTSRVVKPEEVVLAILDLKNKPDGSKVIVDGKRYTFSGDSIGGGKIFRDGNKMSWDYNDTAIYSDIVSPILSTSGYKLTYTENTLDYSSTY